jgi:hypothetical protein
LSTGALAAVEALAGGASGSTWGSSILDPGGGGRTWPFLITMGPCDSGFFSSGMAAVS